MAKWNHTGRCAHCDAEIVGRPRKYCNPQCRNEGRKPTRRADLSTTNKTCAHCGALFAGHGRKKYCSKACAYEVVKIRARSSAPPYVKRKRIKETKDCIVCGNHFIDDRTKAQKQFIEKKYCSKTCADQARPKRRPKRHKSKCSNCGAEFMHSGNCKGIYCSNACKMQGAMRKKHRQSVDNWLSLNAGANSVVNDRKCLTCGGLFTASRTRRSFYCSDVCQSQDKEASAKRSLMSRSGLFTYGLKVCPESGFLFHPRSMKQVYATDAISRKVGRRVSKAKRRAITRGAQADSIDPIAVFEAQNWQCQICGCDTDPTLRGTWEPKAPELDHIIPLAKGGTHTLDNVQCACRECNADKSDSIAA